MQHEKRRSSKDEPKPVTYRIAENPASVADTVDILHDILLDFDSELKFLERNKLKPEPFRLWSQVEPLAWYLNDSLCDWNATVNQKYLADCISLVGTMLLTTIEVLIANSIFTQEPPTIRNLGLVLALILQPSKTACRDELCHANENGWTCHIIRLADEHHVKIAGAEGIDTHIQSLRDRETALKATRHRNRINRFLRETVGLVLMPTEEELAAIVAKEGQTQFRKGTGGRTVWMPEDDYDADGLRLWMRWDFRKEYRHSLGKSGRCYRAL